MRKTREWNEIKGRIVNSDGLYIINIKVTDGEGWGVFVFELTFDL